MNYEFRLPDSKFEAVAPGQRNNISYEQKMIASEEDTFRERLSEEQLRQIAENG